MPIPFRYSLRSLHRRPSRALLAMAGAAIAVFVAVLMGGLSRGLRQSTAGQASADKVVVLGAGSESLEFSSIEAAEVERIRIHPGLARAEDGTPLASPEAYLSAFVRLDGHPGEHRAVVRGVDPVAYAVHFQVRISEGRTPADAFEVLAGGLAETRMGLPSGALAPGQVMSFEGETWRVSGRFEAPGTPFEAELWVRRGDAQAASRRSDVSALSLRARTPDAAADLVFDLATRTDVRVAAWTETDFTAAAARRLRPIALAGTAVTVLLVAGAALAAVNTMWTSVLGRIREMAVLVARGFRRSEVLGAFLAESLIQSLLGGAVGAAAAWSLHGLPMRLPMGAFRFHLPASAAWTGLGLAALIGLAGAVPPLLHAARKPLPVALRNE